MPSAHGAIFCRKELREKFGVRVRFFLRLSQRRRPIFCRKQLREKIGAILHRSKSQRTRTDVLSELLCVTIAGEVSLLDDVTPIFYRTEVSAHGPIFVLSSSEKSSERFYIGAKVSAHEPIFTPIFCLRQNVGPCALGISQRRRPIFYRKQLEKKSDRLFLGPKVSAHGPIFYRSYCV